MTVTHGTPTHSITGSRPTIVCLLFIPRSDLQNAEDNYIHENKLLILSHK